MVEQLTLDFPHSASFYAEDLVVTSSNRAAFNLIKSWPDWSSPTVLLVGTHGSGKSHFAQVWREKAGAFVAHCDNLEEAIKHAQDNVAILLEDLAPGEFSETELFHLLNVVQQQHSIAPASTMLLTSSVSFLHKKIALADLASRLESLPQVTLQNADDELLRAVAIKIFSDLQIQVDSSVLNYLLCRTERSLSALTALIKQLDQLALMRKSKITKGLVSQLLSSNEEKSCL